MLEDTYKNLIKNQREYNSLVEEKQPLLDALEEYNMVVSNMEFLKKEFEKAERTYMNPLVLGKEKDEANQRMADLQGVIDRDWDNLEKRALAAAEALKELGYNVDGSLESFNGMVKLRDTVIPSIDNLRAEFNAAGEEIEKTKQDVSDFSRASGYLHGDMEDYIGILYLYKNGLIDVDTVLKDTGLSVEELTEKARLQAEETQQSADTINQSYDNMAENAESSSDKTVQAFNNIEKGAETSLGNTETSVESLATTTETSMSNVVKAITTAVQDSIKRLRELQEEAEKTGDKVSPIGAAGGALAGIAALQPKRSRIIPQSASAIPIPKLAQGAVIPANREFVAMLGDQRNGTNLEAPESLIRKIFREETAAAGGGANNYQFTAQINRRTLFDEMITEAKLRRVINNKNPFELG